MSGASPEQPFGPREPRDAAPGQPSHAPDSPYGAVPSFGPQPPHAQPPYPGAPSPQSPDPRAPYAQPPYGQPSFGQPPYQPPHGHPSYGHPSYGHPSYGQPPYGRPPYAAQPHPFPPGYPAYPGHPYPPQPGAIDPALLADQGMRLLARVVDTFLMMLVMAIGVVPAAIWASRNDGSAATLAGWTAACWAVLVFLTYEPVTTGLLGWTPGKRLCNLRVARLEDGGRLGLARSYGRYGIHVLMSLAGSLCLAGMLDALWCCWDRPNRQCLHDKPVRSVVVKINP
ncbi:hypothetical protein GCM10027168_56760 [Streptomyces capparidis]